MSLKTVEAPCGPLYVPEAHGTGAGTQASIHILLVDDDTLARHIVRKALEKCHYKGAICFSLSSVLPLACRDLVKLRAPSATGLKSAPNIVSQCPCVPGAEE